MKNRCPTSGSWNREKYPGILPGSLRRYAPFSHVNSRDRPGLQVPSGKKIRPQPFKFLNNCLPGIYHKPVNPEGVGIQTSFFLQLPFENFLFEL